MNENPKHKQPSQQELTLYCFAGEALCAVQHVEEALSHSIAMKKNPWQRNEANALLEKHRTYTLGRAIAIAIKDKLYTEILQKSLDDFLSKRNWPIHKSIAQNRIEWDKNISQDNLLSSIKAITIEAHRLQRLIEEDLIQFAEAHGKDKSRVRDEIKKYYFE